MSLLLNALKKAEDGEQKSVAADSDSTPAVLQPEAEASPAAPQPIDLDSIVEDSADSSQTPESPGGDGSRRQRVHAAKIFGASSAAQDAESGGGFSKFLYAILGLAAVGGGGYFVLAGGFIPGVDLQSFRNLLGQSAPPQVVQAKVEAGAQLKISKDIVLLPVPAVDVQSEIDFSALRLPESTEGVAKEAYVKQIAVLTGFDIAQENKRKAQEQRELLLDLNLEQAEEEGSAEAGIEAQESVPLPAEQVIRTADASRKAKTSFDQTTLSDRALDIKVDSGGAAGLQSDSGADAAKVAQARQVEVNPSTQGLERKHMLNQARVLYHKGNYLEAETIYRNVLVMSPTSRDALRGIAQIAVVTGRYQTAVAAYLDLLSYYPGDPIAVAELTNLRGDNGNFYEIEDALKNALGKIPSADSRLYFSLGNLYAQNGKILEAQQAYFEAFSRESNNPDYAYNLAVTLDYLNKPDLASRYYGSALSLSENAPAGFSRAEVEARIRDLN